MLYIWIANSLSISRFFIPVILFTNFIQGGIKEKLFWAILLAATDLVDGWFARKSKRKSRWGKWLDHSADKISFLFFALFLGFKGIISWWFLLPAIFSETAVVFSNLRHAKKTGVLLVATIGKQKMFCFFMGLSFSLLDLYVAGTNFYNDLAHLLIFLGTIMSLLSFWEYRSIGRRA